MSMVPAREIVRDASARGYAIAAINCQGGNYDIVRAVLETAEEENAPVILMAYEKNTEYYGLDWLPTIVSQLGRSMRVPVAVHLDHGQDVTVVKRATELGYTSVMIDYSTRSIEENIAANLEVIEAARPAGISVEAELGELQRNDGTPMKAAENLVDPGQVRRFLDGAPVDMLAVGIGNAHGFYKGEPDIRIDLLEEVQKVSGDTPLVLHGTTGIPEPIVKKCISHGMAKINFGTLVRVNFMTYMAEEIAKEDEHKGHIWRVCRKAEARLKEDVRGIIRLTGSNGKA